MSIKISELIELVEACGKAGVKTFKHETEKGLPINIEFHQIKVPQETVVHVPQKDSVVDVPQETVVHVPQKDSVVDVPQEIPIEISQQFELNEQNRLLEDDFDLLPIQDPERFEELLANGKLEHYGEVHA